MSLLLCKKPFENGSGGPRRAWQRKLHLEVLEERWVPDAAGLPAQLKPDDCSLSPLSAQTVTVGHFGSSPFTPPDKADQEFVADQGPGLDTGCSFRSDGPLLIDLPIDRFFGSDIPHLIQEGLLPSTVDLTMPAFDVDVNGVPGDPSIPPERDLVTFVGKDGVEHQLGYLNGDNNIWQLNTFQIDTTWINLPSDPGQGGTLAPADNTIRIDIDTASVPDENWCTAIDWVSVNFPAPDPVLLVHGILSGSGTWAPVWTTGLTDVGIPYEAIDMGALDSIQNNAGKIAGQFQEMKNRWGIDKINIIAHSKGGLDSRDFAESNDVVDKLIQIGTPNDGSPLADVIQAGLIDTVGFLPTGIIDLLAPAAYQLTTPYMAAYNASHGYDPNAQYLSLAGNYKFGGLGIVDELISAFYGGPSDLIVPVSSVHGLSFSSPLDYASTGGNDQARHTGQTSSSDIYNQLIGLLTGIVPHANVASSQSTAAPAPASGSHFANSATIFDSVAQGAVSVHELPIDNNAGSVGFTLTYKSGDLDLTLVSPSGRIIDQTVTDPNIEFQADESNDGLKREFYAFKPGAETGLWSVMVRGTSVTDPSGAEPYSVVGSMAQSNIQMSATLDTAFASVGQPLVIRATLTNGGAPLPGATVNARVLRPDHTTADLVLQDDGLGKDAVAGDGIYSGQFTGTTQTGTYEVIVKGQGSSPAAFSREAVTVASVAHSGASLTGTYSSTGIDTNGNGLFDQLRVAVGVSTPVGGKYRLEGTLQDSHGSVIQTVLTDVNLAAGVSTVNLNFDGKTIFAHGVNGPYTLASVTLRENVDDILVPVASATAAHKTAAYSVGQFEHNALSLLGTGSEQAVDSDHNGHFDTLTVSLDAAVNVSGFYQWSGSLLDSNGRVAAIAHGSASLSTGVNRISFVFNGVDIWSSQLNGPYHVGAISIIGGSQGLLTDSTFTTQAYNANDFQHGPNLTVTAFQLPDTAAPGQIVTLNYTVSNVGEQATNSGSWVDSLYLSTDGVLGGSGETFLANLTPPGNIAVGGRYSHTYSFVVPANYRGNLFVIVKVDSTDDVPEGPGESDNVFISHPLSVGLTKTSPTVTAPGDQNSVEGASQKFQLGTFSDPDGGPWTVDVNWGDSTPDTIFTASAPGPLGIQSHTYTEEGPEKVTITVTDSTKLSDSKSFMVTVTDPAVVATGVAVNAFESNPLSGAVVATFTDPGGPEPNSGDPSGTTNDHYKVDSIDWGDSTPLDTSSAAISLSGSTFTVRGDHTYMKEGTYTVTTTIDHEGVITTVKSMATVKDNLGLLVLDPTGKGALTVSGNGGVTVNGPGGAIVVNSSNDEAAVISGNGNVTASDLDITGGTRATGQGGFLEAPIEHEAAMQDPLGLPLPPAPSTTYAAVDYSGSAPFTLQPGTYVGGIKIRGQGPVTLAPGVYYLQSGGFSVSGQGSVTGSGVLIVNAPSKPGDTISFTGQGSVSLSAPTDLTGAYAPYNGIALFQDPASGAPLNITGQGGLTMTGILYAPGATLNITGQGGMTINADPAHGLGAEGIVFGLKITGNGGLTINVAPPGATAAGRSPSAPSSAATIDAHSAALGAITSAGGSTGPATLTDPTLLNDVAASLVNANDGSWPLSHKKKSSS